MSDIVLHGCPKACSLVSHIALEKTGTPFTYSYIDLFGGEQRAEAYLARNPRGKVPMIEVGGRYITENISILHWLSAAYPAAALLPSPGRDRAYQAMSDLAWFTSGIHPIMTRMLRPDRFLAAEDARSALRMSAIEALSAELALIEARLEGRTWWFDDWSAIDAYLLWIWARSGDGPIDLSVYPNYARHIRTMLSIAEVQRVLDRERGHMPCFETLDKVIS